MTLLRQPDNRRKIIPAPCARVKGTAYFFGRNYCLLMAAVVPNL